MKPLKFALEILLFALPALGADIPIAPTGPVYAFASNPQGTLAWGTTGAGGFNNNFFFTPYFASESVCVFVYNNNPTNAHTFTASINVTGNPAEKTPSDGTWQAAANSSGITSPAFAGTPGGISGLVSGISQVSVNFSAGSTLAGSPDTASVIIIQTQGNCFAGNQMIASAPNTNAAMPPIQAISDGLSQAWVWPFGVTNPGTNAVIVGLTVNGGAKTAYFDKAVVSCTAVCSLIIAGITNTGTGCTLTPIAAIGNMKTGSTQTSVSSGISGACATTNPAQSVAFQVDLSAGVPFTVDLKGFISPAGTTTGIDVVNATTFTGQAHANIFWYEK